MRPAAGGAGLGGEYAVLCAAVREAAALALRHFHEGVESWDKEPDHPVSKADLAVNELLEERLRGARPEYGWLSEESPDDHDRLSCRRVWTVDPIDGTRAFLRGEPEFTVCAALVEDGRPVAGAVANPATGEVFEAVAGGGARRNCVALRVVPDRPLAEATILGSLHLVREAAGPLPGTQFQKVHSIAYRIVRVAAGEGDAAVAMAWLWDWDFAAAEIVLLEAGGAMSDRTGAELRYNIEDVRHDDIVVAAPGLHAELVSRLARPGGT